MSILKTLLLSHYFLMTDSRTMPLAGVARAGEPGQWSHVSGTILPSFYN